MKRTAVIIAVLLLTCMRVSAQTDFGAWEVLKVNKPIDDKITTWLSLEHRSKDNCKNLDIAIVIPGVSYKLSSWMTVGIMYNYIVRDAGNLNRLLPFATASKKFGQFSMALREMGQYTIGNGDFLLRSKATFKYSIPDCMITPRLELETYLDTSKAYNGDFTNPFVNIASSTGIIRAKNIMGVDIKVSDRISLLANYLYYYLGATTPGRHCIQTGLTFNI